MENSEMTESLKEGNMELDRLKEYINFMEENNLSELEIEEEGRRIKLKKNSPQQQPIVYRDNPKILEEESKQGLIEVKSPMVGTFYRAPSPGAKPYVEIGDIVKPGDVVCIIEAMKLMNEIKAEIGGKVSQILIENGEPVEFGQNLFLIEPA